MTNIHFLFFTFLHPRDFGPFGSSTAGFLVLVFSSLYFQERGFNMNALCMLVDMASSWEWGAQCPNLGRERKTQSSGFLNFWKNALFPC